MEGTKVRSRTLVVCFAKSTQISWTISASHRAFSASNTFLPEIAGMDHWMSPISSVWVAALLAVCFPAAELAALRLVLNYFQILPPWIPRVIFGSDSTKQVQLS